MAVSLVNETPERLVTSVNEVVSIARAVYRPPGVGSTDEPPESQPTRTATRNALSQRAARGP